MATAIYIDIDNELMGHLAAIIKDVSRSIGENYGAGNCTPDDTPIEDGMAFWTSSNEPTIVEGQTRINIELNTDEWDNSEVSSAVGKVTTAETGEIKMFGNVIGHWTTTKG